MDLPGFVRGVAGALVVLLSTPAVANQPLSCQSDSLVVELQPGVAAAVLDLDKNDPKPISPLGTQGSAVIVTFGSPQEAERALTRLLRDKGEFIVSARCKDR